MSDAIERAASEGLPMVKLTTMRHVGWYLCRNEDDEVSDERCYWWDGREIRWGPKDARVVGWECLTDFRGPLAPPAQPQPTTKDITDQQGRVIVKMSGNLDFSQPQPTLACHDCGRHYGDEHGFPDLVVPDDVWQKISPSGNEGGLLCPSCICKRLHDLGIECDGRFMSGPLCEFAHPQPIEPESELDISVRIPPKESKPITVKLVQPQPSERANATSCEFSHMALDCLVDDESEWSLDLKNNLVAQARMAISHRPQPQPSEREGPDGPGVWFHREQPWIIYRIHGWTQLAASPCGPLSFQPGEPRPLLELPTGGWLKAHPTDEPDHRIMPPSTHAYDMAGACECVNCARLRLAAATAEVERLQSFITSLKVNIETAVGRHADSFTELGLKDLIVTLKQRLEAAEARVAEAVKKLEDIVCVAEPDRGVVLLSYDGPTHYDTAAKCQVYDHQNFSPLGDALIALHDLLSGKPPTPGAAT